MVTAFFPQSYGHELDGWKYIAVHVISNWNTHDDDTGIIVGKKIAPPPPHSMLKEDSSIPLHLYISLCFIKHNKYLLLERCWEPR